MIKLLLEVKLSFCGCNMKLCLKVLALKVDINLLNQHYKPADGLADWLTDLLRHFDSQGTKSIGHWNTWDTQCTEGIRRALGHSVTRALKALGQLGTWGPRALEGHLDTWALEALGHLVTQALGHSGTRKAVRHSGTQALEALYLADSCHSQ